MDRPMANMNIANGGSVTQLLFIFCDFAWHCPCDFGPVRTKEEVLAAASRLEVAPPRCIGISGQVCFGEEDGLLFTTMAFMLARFKKIVGIIPILKSDRNGC